MSSRADASWQQRLRQVLLTDRRTIEDILAAVDRSGEPISFLEQDRIDRHVAQIARLAKRLENR